MTHWKTTAIGVLGIISVVSGVAITILKTGSIGGIDWTATGAALAASWGLIFAADASNVQPPK